MAAAIVMLLWVLGVVLWLMTIVAFFSMAINTLRIRKEVELLRDVVEVQFHHRNQTPAPRTQPPAGNSSQAPFNIEE